MGAPTNRKQLGSGAPGAIVRAVAVAVVVSGAAAVLAAITLEPTRSCFGPWSRLWGKLTGTAAFGLTLMATGPGRRVGMLLAAGVFAIVGLGVLWFMTGFGFPSLLSPEGLWMWPLAIGSLRPPASWRFGSWRPNEPRE